MAGSTIKTTPKTPEGQLGFEFPAATMAPRPVAAASRKPVPSTIPSRKRADRSGEKGSPRRGATAETLAKQQRDISVSEFFAKNRHLLGFDNKRKALLTTVKEAVDNSLDACEEAGVLPEIVVTVKPGETEDDLPMIKLDGTYVEPAADEAEPVAAGQADET